MQITFPPSKHLIVTKYPISLTIAQMATGKSKTHIVNWVFSRLQPNYATEVDMQADLAKQFEAYIQKFKK